MDGKLLFNEHTLKPLISHASMAVNSTLKRNYMSYFIVYLKLSTFTIKEITVT